MTYSLHPGAEQDVADALDFYKEQAGLLVAQRFLDEFERIAGLLAMHPGFGTSTTKGAACFHCVSSLTLLCTGALRLAFKSSSFAISTEGRATAVQEGNNAAKVSVMQRPTLWRANPLRPSTTPLRTPP